MTGETSEDPIGAALRSDDIDDRLDALRSLVDEPPADDGSAEALVDDVLPLLEDEPAVREAATIALVRAGVSNRAHLEALEDRLDHDSPAVRGCVVDVFDGLSKTTPQAIAPAADSIATVLADRYDASEGARPADCEGEGEDEAAGANGDDDDSSSPDRPARLVTILERVVRTDPSALLHSVDDLVSIAETSSNGRVRSTALGILTAIAADHPDRCDAAIDPASDALEEASEASARANAAFLLAMLAEAYPTDVADALEGRLEVAFEMLGSSVDREQNAAVGLLAYVAEDRPNAVEPAAGEILALLEHDLESVRGNAVWTLSFLGGEEARARLAAVAEIDSDERVRRLAGEAVAALETG